MTDRPNSTGVQEIVVLVMYYITHVVSLVKNTKKLTCENACDLNYAEAV